MEKENRNRKLGERVAEGMRKNPPILGDTTLNQYLLERCQKHPEGGGGNFFFLGGGEL